MLPPIGEAMYAAKVLEVHSGDDLVMMVDLNIDGLFKRVRTRLHKVDTPDAYKADSKSEAGKVRDQVRELVSDKECYITVHAARKSGWIVTVHVCESKDPASCVNLNELLMSEGYVYSGPTTEAVG